LHCAEESDLCDGATGVRPDRLPDEPGGYDGFQALYGHKYTIPRVHPEGPLTDLDGRVIQDSHGNPGFPSFDGMSASTSLAYVLAMQEHGVPVTFAYLSDVHDDHVARRAYGPGQAAYVATLRDYDRAFATFFDRLEQDGINSSNTLFVVTSDEGDHFTGVQQTGCDGVTVPCTYGPGEIGELNTNVRGLLATQRGNLTPFQMHNDSSPTFYLNGNPSRDAAVTRTFDRDLAALTSTLNPFTGQHDEVIADLMADTVEMKILHMITADPARTPTVTLFAKPDYYLFSGPPNCGSPCISINAAFAWTHGTHHGEITTTWLGLVGPGVRAQGLDDEVWSDHTDIRPTMLALLGLGDDYRSDGRVLVEDLERRAVPHGMRPHTGLIIELASVYKQLNAGVGEFALDTLEVSNRALKSGSSSDDSTYARLEAALMDLGNRRDALAGEMIAVLDAAAFEGQHINVHHARRLIERGRALLAEAHDLAH
jgi:hypothetical protein